MRKDICLSSENLFVDSLKLVKKWHVLSPNPHVHCPLTTSDQAFSLQSVSSLLPLGVSMSRPRSSVSRLQLCVFVYWTLSRKAFSNKIVAKTSVTVFLKITRLPIKLHRMKMQVSFHIYCIRGTFQQKCDKSNPLHLDSILLGDKSESPDLLTFILLSSARTSFQRCFHLFSHISINIRSTGMTFHWIYSIITGFRQKVCLMLPRQLPSEFLPSIT